MISHMEVISVPPTLIKYSGTPRVSMSNALARSAQGLSLHEKRLLALCISKLDSGRHWTPEKLTVRVSISEYRKVFEIPNDKNVYSDLATACSTLEERLIVFYDDKDKDVEHHVRWVGRTTYAKSKGWIEVVFFHELAPHLFKLRKQFTTYHLKQATALRTVYAWRLLELLMQFASTGVVRITLEAFWHAMEAPDSCRKSFKDLRRRIIEPAVSELKNRESLIISWRPKKTGRKVTSLEFSFDYDPQRVLNF